MLKVTIDTLGADTITIDKGQCAAPPYRPVVVGGSSLSLASEYFLLVHTQKSSAFLFTWSKNASLLVVQDKGISVKHSEMDISVLAAVGSFVVSERVLKPKATVLVILGSVLAYDLTTKTHDVSSLRVYRGKL
jgi:hypothetical protein